MSVCWSSIMSAHAFIWWFSQTQPVPLQIAQPISVMPSPSKMQSPGGLTHRGTDYELP